MAIFTKKTPFLNHHFVYPAVSFPGCTVSISFFPKMVTTSGVEILTINGVERVVVKIP